MNAEMPHIVALLAQLGGRIRRPLWAFSDVVAPAEIVRGQLKAQTSGGTSMRCVIEHLTRTRPAAAIVLTDGYIETLPKALVAKIAGVRLHVLVTRDGNPAQIAKAGLPYTQLEKLPT
jgi:predicted metal-dependent peptidase